MKASTTFSRLTSFFCFSPPLELGDLGAQFIAQLFQVDRRQQLADGFGADLGGEAVIAVFVLGLVELVFRQELTLLERRQARLDDDVVLEIENPLEILQRHVEHQADARRQRLQEPDMGDRRGQLDMAHAVAAHLLHRDFDAALFADDALVLHALVLAAQAFVVLHRPEDAGAEQPVALRLEGAVVDRLRLFDLAMAPAQDLVRAGQRNLDAVEGGNFLAVPEDIHQLLIHYERPFDLVTERIREFASGSPQSAARCRCTGLDSRFAGMTARYVVGPFTSSTLSDSERISLTSTLKDSGIPASNVSSPRTIAS